MTVCSDVLVDATANDQSGHLPQFVVLSVLFFLTAIPTLVEITIYIILNQL